MQTSIEIKKLVQPVFGKHKDYLVFAYLFGSTAQDKVFPLSDIDIAVYFSKGESDFCSDMKILLYTDISRALQRNDVDVVVLNKTKNIMLLDEIVRHGIVLFDKDIHLRLDFETNILHSAFDFKSQRMAVMGI